MTGRSTGPSVLQSPKAEAEHKKKRSFKSYTKRAALVFVALIVFSGGWMGFKVYRNIAKITNNSNPFSLLSAFQPVTLKGQDTGRVNILLAGNSADDPGHQGSNLYDSIMILSLDTRDNTAFMLSVPRDLLVDIPSLGYQKINTTGTVKDFRAAGYPNGGMGQLEALLEKNLGLDINYYALINYTAFRDTVNAVGGVSVNIASTDKRGLYDPNIAKVDGGPLKLTNGTQQLDGQTALNLARARGDHSRAYGFPASDFDRTAHQRQLLMALKAKVSSSSVLADPLKIGKLADAMGNNISTDMKLNEMETFYSLTRKLNDGQIKSYNINKLDNKQMLANYTTSAGQSALVPAAGVDDFSDIQASVRKLSSTDPLVKESASVVILNGGDIAGLAKRQANSLTAKGLNVLTTADAPEGMLNTTVISGAGAASKTGTKAALQKLYGVTTTTNAALAKQYPSADFIIVLGTNFGATTSTSSAATAQ
ncbi:MAG: hypothetical protein JWM37_656 [Candidatus Saccharibacteria bacterium]|nr:hypothetical protein [Candidatus Saccharibacteria bacterium]